VLRRDWLFIPAATAVFPNLLRKATDLRLDYKFEKNNSNVDFDSYHNHQITASVLFRF
jgi:hypothetical protein